VQQNLLAGFVPQPATLGEILTTAKNVAYQAVATKETVVFLRRRVLGMSVLLPLRPLKAGLDKRPTSSHPVTVATVNQLICAAGKATLRCVLP
jgi:hypothetical protein